MCNYGSSEEERKRSGVKEVGEGRREGAQEECMCNVIKERREQEEVGRGREGRA